MGNQVCIAESDSGKTFRLKLGEALETLENVFSRWQSRVRNVAGLPPARSGCDHL